MKKYKDIKIIKENSSNNNNNYTFIDDANILKPDKIHLMHIKEEIDYKQSTKIINNKEEKYKKKKVISKFDSNSNFDKALKFTNPSQRNHSSVYE